MKYLSTQRFALVTIEDRQAIRFTVPAELAVMIFWFLASQQAQLVALITWWFAYGLVRRYRNFCNYLASWQADLSLMRLVLSRLLPDLLTIQVANCYG